MESIVFSRTGLVYYKGENTEEQTAISLVGWLSFKKIIEKLLVWENHNLVV